MWELDVRGYAVRIVGTTSTLTANVRARGDWRCHWLPWSEVPLVVGQIVLADMTTFAEKLAR